MTRVPFVLMLVMAMLLAAVSSSPVVDEQGVVNIHVRNELNPGRVLYVHCHCTDHDLGDNYINVGVQYDFRFKVHFIRKNLWQCYLAPDYDRHLYFHVFDEDTPSDVDDSTWVAKEDGIYYRYPDYSPPIDQYRYGWDNNTN
ncbi:S-protein homolog 21 [Linum grandiflorum]